MTSGKLIGKALPTIPWEERPTDCRDVVWRYSGNPVIPRDLIPSSNSIFNSAVVAHEGEFRGVFRCDDKRRYMQLHAGRSQDGIHWRIDNDRIHFVPADGVEPTEWLYGYDPRVCFIEDRYYVTWCNGFAGWPTIGVATTQDFQTYYQMENAFLPFNRNGVMFPRKIQGAFAMLSRPSDRAHTPFGEIYYSESPDMTHWGKHRFVMRPTRGWQATKVGAGPIPIETTEGWLIFYHGVLTSCNGFVYSMGAALLDLEQPWKVIARTEPYLLHPRELYEQVGDVPNVVFPCAALADADTGRIALYYGAADTVTCMAFCHVSEIIEFIRKNAL
ncbi:glycoside hydrolase family 130 protein [Candidatus Bipolaricaulota bacterium]|nr:glycoside hydrolase family 130 protein [Candidatus Bipolaricaulota bacterium]TFH11270.1 MAG: glycosidase [Candidatus Atribacteria bacterium]